MSCDQVSPKTLAQLVLLHRMGTEVPMVEGIVVSYTNLRPYRPHVLVFQKGGHKVRFLTHNGAVRDSDWHGHTDFVLGCEEFIIFGLSYKGEAGDRKHNLVFVKHRGTLTNQLQRYVGFEMVEDKEVSHVAELIVVLGKQEEPVITSCQKPSP